MRHDELLAICDNYSFKDSAEPVKVLRAIVELHKPDIRGNCDICSWIIGKPGFVRYEVCPTIQVIEKELV